MKLLVNNSTLLTMNKRDYDKAPVAGAQVVTDTEAKYIGLMLDPGSTWTEQNIIGFRKKINSGNNMLLIELFHGLTNDDDELTEWSITAEQSQKGIDYLRKTLFKANGELRNTELVRETESELIEAVRDFKSFSFVDVTDLTQQSGWEHYTAVYRIHTHSGLKVDYTYTANGYQRGGIFEVTRVDRSEQHTHLE